jgi:hypothetical protein
MSTPNTDKETVIITKEEYDSLLEDSRVLAALHAGGVDNWEWYDVSLEGIYDDE